MLHSALDAATRALLLLEILRDGLVSTFLHRDDDRCLGESTDFLRLLGNCLVNLLDWLSERLICVLLPALGLEI